MAGRALLAGVCLAVLVTLAGIAPLGPALALFATIAWFSAPGVLLMRRLYRREAGAWGAALLAGPALGYFVSSITLLAYWALGCRGALWIALAPIPGLLPALPVGRLAPHIQRPSLTRRDGLAVAFVLLAVPAIVGRPYARVGADLPEGRAYRAYFTADFVWEMTVTSEVSKGALPPKNPFYVDDALHYYWLMYLLPGAEHAAAGAAVRLDDILLVNAFWVGLIFAGFLYWCTRHVVDSPAAAACGSLFVLGCSSFEGAERLWVLWQSGAPLDSLRSVNIDAVANWFYQGMKVDGLHRALLYQPQHELGYVLGFSGLLLVMQARRAASPLLLLVVGLCLSGAMLFSPVSALMLTGATAIYVGARLLAERAWLAMVPCAAMAALPMAASLGLIAALQYVDSATGDHPIVRVGLNDLAMHRVVWSGFLNFGPVLMVAAAGALAGIRGQARTRLLPMGLVIVIATAFYFWVDVPEHDSVYVAWRASHLMFVAGAGLVAVAADEWGRRGLLTRALAGACALGIAVAALPTVVIDVYNAQDVANRAMGPGFRWTVVLSPPEIETLDWIKANTLPDARVQIEPFARERDAYYVTAFAERRMAGGLPTGLIPLAKYRAVSERLRGIYTATDGPSAHAEARALCVDYLMVGPPERNAYPHAEATFESAPHLFRTAFRNDAGSLYAVAGERDCHQASSAVQTGAAAP